MDLNLSHSFSVSFFTVKLLGESATNRYASGNWQLMLLELLQFAPRQSTALCHGQPLFMAGCKSDQFSAGREPGSELPAVRRC